MHKTNVHRIVNGNPIDPNSTRDLVGVCEKEMRHLNLCVQAAIREDQLLISLDDQKLIAILKNANSINEQFGFSGGNSNEVDVKSHRNYIAERKPILESLATKIQSATDSDSLCGFTPKEYEHLITSVQAGVREASIFASFSDEEILQGVNAVKRVFEEMKLPIWDVYDYAMEKPQDFFLSRAMICRSLLVRMNQPHKPVLIFQ